MLIFAVFSYFCMISVVKISYEWNWNIMESEDVYETGEFLNVFTNTLDTIILTDVYYKSEESIVNGDFINHSSLLKSFNEYYNIQENIITENTYIDEEDKLQILIEVPESLQSFYQNYKKIVDDNWALYRATNIQMQLNEFKKSKLYIQELKNFYYLIETEDGVFVSGNALKKDIQNASRNIRIDSDRVLDNMGNAPIHYSNEYFKSQEYVLYASIREPLYNEGTFYELYNEYMIAKAHMPFLYIILFVSTIVMFMGYVYNFKISGQTQKKGTVYHLRIDEFYNDIHLICTCFLIAFIMYIGNYLAHQVYIYQDVFWNNVFIMLLLADYIVFLVVILSYLTSVSRQIKRGTLVKNTAIYRVFYTLEYLNSNRTFKSLFIVKYVSYALFNGIFVYFAIDGAFSDSIIAIVFHLFLFLLINYIFVMYFANVISSLQEISAVVKAGTDGDLEAELDLSKVSVSFLDFAENILDFRQSFKDSQEEARKSEELKTELIANVSHDLRTPLTSIISYIDILEHIEADPESTKKYIGIINEKAHRLNQLIEDLIEASQLSNGSLQVNPMPIKYRQLCLQCLGELDDKIVDSGIEVVVNSEDDVLICADGRHLARVLENLISNAIKYSSENSRVDIDITKDDNMANLSIKNISATEMNFTKEQVVARFFRGDTARTTDGTGLGLAIAESLTNLQKGKFDVKIDKMKFEVIVSMQLWTDSCINSSFKG